MKLPFFRDREQENRDALVASLSREEEHNRLEDEAYEEIRPLVGTYRIVKIVKEYPEIPLTEETFRLECGIPMKWCGRSWKIDWSGRGVFNTLEEAKQARAKLIFTTTEEVIEE